MVEGEDEHCSGATEWLEETRSACFGISPAVRRPEQHLYCNGESPENYVRVAAAPFAGVSALPHVAQKRLPGAFAELHFEQSVPARSASR